MPMDRRQFIALSAGGAFVLAVSGARGTGAGVFPWIRIEPDGRAVLYSTVSDMGQGSRTGQVQILADELDLAWDSISVEMAPDADPYLHDGQILTGGSGAIRIRYHKLRLAAATARAMLVAAAAARWGVAADTCRTDAGVVIHDGSGRRLSYGALAAEASAMAPPVKPPFKTVEERRYIGRDIRPLGVRDRSTGTAVYGIDIKLPRMLHATVIQCPAFGGALVSVDEAPALAVPGVRNVIRLPAALAVVADSTWSAFRGAKVLGPVWSRPEQPATTQDLARRLLAAFDAENAQVAPAKGGTAARAALRQRFAAAPRKVEATYEAPYLSHAPLEPMNAVAAVGPDKIEIWAPTQVPTRVRRDVAHALGRSPEEVELHVTLLGGGFGRRLKTDYAVLAALVAREAGAPVQVLWTREEDLTHDFYRPAALMTWRAAIEPDGSISGYEMVGAATNDTIFGGADPAPYALADYAITQTEFHAGAPVGAWRSVDASIAGFGRESFIDECAHAAGADPLAYRRRLLGDNARGRRVIDAAAERIGWDRKRPKGTGVGLALFEGWDTLVAHAIEVRIEGRALKVTRLVVAADPGTVINPSQARAQLEGGGLMALGAALGEAVTITDGKVDQHNFDSYPLLRMRQAPPIETILFESPRAKIGGLGEPPVPGVAAALANAVFAATGERVRKLPFRSAGFAV